MLILKIWHAEKLTSEWKIGLICPIHKKGDKTVCRNYRGISLLNTTYKLLSNLLLDRLKPYAIKGLGNYQAGFQAGKSTIDLIFCLRQLFEKGYEYGLDLHCIFIDFQRAYDSVLRGVSASE